MLKINHSRYCCDVTTHKSLNNKQFCIIIRSLSGAMWPRLNWWNTVLVLVVWNLLVYRGLKILNVGCACFKNIFIIRHKQWKLILIIGIVLSVENHEFWFLLTLIMQEHGMFKLHQIFRLHSKCKTLAVIENLKKL